MKIIKLHLTTFDYIILSRCQENWIDAYELRYDNMIVIGGGVQLCPN